MNLISKRVQNFQSSGIRKIFDLAVSLKNPINFSIGQPDFGVTKAVQIQTIEAINKNLSHYTPTFGIEALRKKIAEKLLKENSIKTDRRNILVTSGTSAAIFLALSVLVDPDDEVIIPDPYFVEYPELTKFLEGKPIFLDTYPNFQIDPKKLEKLITKKTKVIIINSPNNPTGAVYSEEILRKIAEIGRKNNLIIISDEIYEKFIYDNKTHFSIGSIYKNTITVNGLSKSGGMTGWRLGWASGPKDIISKMGELQQYTIVCAPSIVQYGALAAFESPNHAKEYQQKRDIIFNLLSKKFETVKPEGAFYIMPKVGDGEKFAEWAIKNNCLLIPGSVFSRKNTHIRISFATSNETLEKGAKILLKY